VNDWSKVRHALKRVCVWAVKEERRKRRKRRKRSERSKRSERVRG